MTYDEPQQVSGHYGLCLEPGHPSICLSCSARWAEDWPDDEPLLPTVRGRSRTVVLLDEPADPERPTLAELAAAIDITPMPHAEETTMPRQIIPDAQDLAFRRALAERLGLDLHQLTHIHADVSLDDAVITWTGKATLPADEVTALMNAARA